MTEGDFRRISHYMDENALRPIDYGKERCCFQNADRTCMVWAARPQVCRLHSCQASRLQIVETDTSLQVDEDLWLVDMHEAFVNGAMAAEADAWGSWSADGQTPAYLAATRMASLADENVSAILSQLELEPGMRVLDVGCGSGEYCFRLGSQVQGVSFTGVDSDEGFVRFATARANGEVDWPYEAPSPANDFQFICADGSKLPFEDATFDAVVSHTYLTAIPCWEEGLAEMRRVCKPGGAVSSVTSLTDDFYGTGTVRLFSQAAPSGGDDLVRRVDEIAAGAFPNVDLTAGIAPRDVPAAFAQAGLSEVRCVPLGHYFCLSDAALAPEGYRRHVELLRLVEEERLTRLLANPAARSQLPDEDWARFAALIEDRHAELVALQGGNAEWDWYGNASLLVVGQR